MSVERKNQAPGEHICGKSEANFNTQLAITREDHCSIFTNDHETLFACAARRLRTLVSLQLQIPSRVFPHHSHIGGTKYYLWVVEPSPTSLDGDPLRPQSLVT